ncbi:MAG: SUMF1/EgtB/PvdO family nonheme iron enzyme [Candidatus Latescibacterota bacterium]|jgi:hypothetical protein
MRNSLGMELVELPAGSFLMGQADGDLDERPVHPVALTRPILMAATPVTNVQYEAFDPGHRRFRGVRELSSGDREAVVHVGWHEAVAFCDWLSAREGKPYRLPTEAEWEYACRANTSTLFHTGDLLPPEYHRHQEDGWDPVPVSLEVGTAPANPFGLHDLHGLVEEWCLDWHGPYRDQAEVDPVGPESGTFRVTRGGSHNTGVRYLRSANRLGALPGDRHWLIGFRVVQAPPAAGVPWPAPSPPAVTREVAQAPFAWTPVEHPFFAEPIPFVRDPEPESGTPFYPHNHCPAIAWCPNGDLLAVWYSTITEVGRELTILASRLRAGAAEWEPASEFFKAPDRNMTGSALLHDGQGTLYHTNGIEAAGHWANLALAVRTSTDNGATWSAPCLADPEHRPRNQVIAGLSLTELGWLVQPCDAVWSGSGGTAIHLSRDRGLTWEDPGAGTPPPDFQADLPGGTIAGIHAGVVALQDGRFLAFGRGDDRLENGPGSRHRMPMSLSADLGRSWRYEASPFPPISGGQRLVLMRLREGPLLLVSFTDASDRTEPEGLPFPIAGGGQRQGYGAFASLSFDEGRSWPVRKLLTDGRQRHLDGGAWTRGFSMDRDHAEPRGYLAATQSPNRVIHLLSSRLHYRFTLTWLQEPARGG